MGRRLHLLPDLGRDGLRGVRVRRVLPPDRRLARRHRDDHPAGPGRPGAGHLDRAPAKAPATWPAWCTTPTPAAQYTSIAFTEPARRDRHRPLGRLSAGDAYDNALAESQIGLFKTELFYPHGPWRDRDHLEPAVLDWVTWFNTERSHESIDDLTPIAAEQLHYRYRASLAEAG